MTRMKYVVSACLAGINCNYKGQGKPCKEVIELCKKGEALPLCPESLGELPVPREPSEIINGRVMSRDGRDVTANFELGAQRAMAKALASGARIAIVKSKSPSCGYKQIYDGSFNKKLCEGNGVWTEKLLSAGFEIYTEKNLPAQSASPTCQSGKSAS